ncbi:cyclophilin-like fold protein [Dyadobacter psychrophilus]|nr:cyclophilin-like fold protein [Dyadobacter psychrophilus]
MIVLLGFLFLTANMACKTDDPTIPDTNMENDNEMMSDTTSNQLKINIGSKTFMATLVDNPTVTAFKAKLPLTVSMSELNGNEKLYNFPSNLPINPSNPRTINTGDLMIYSSNVLVLFYKSFSTSYSYTRLGRIANPAGLEAALAASAAGSGDVTVTFELE